MNTFGFEVDRGFQDLLFALAFGAINLLRFRFDSEAQLFSIIKGH